MVSEVEIGGICGSNEVDVIVLASENSYISNKKR